MLADFNVFGRSFHAGKCRKIRTKSMNGSAGPQTLQLQGQEGVGDEVGDNSGVGQVAVDSE